MIRGRLLAISGILLVLAIGGHPTNCFLPAVAAQEPSISAALRRAIVGPINQANLTIESDGDASIDSAITNAVRRYDPARRDEAVANAARLGRAIVAVVRAQGGNVTAAVVATGLSRLCPLWPFC